jgi:hypothetical protein
MEGLCKSQFRGDLFPGKTINFPYQTPVTVANYTFSTNTTINPFVQTSNTYAVDQIKVATANYDPLQNLQGYDLSPEDQLADDMGYALSRNINQYAAGIGLAGAQSSIAAGTISAGNVFELLTSANATLTNNRARTGARFALVTPDFKAVLANCDKSNGFQMADEALKVGYVGKSSAGFGIYETQELPYTQALTLVTNPTAGDTLTIGGAGVTFEFVANGTAAAAGEISIGGSAGATQAIVVNALNGTGTPGASTYIDVDNYLRRTLTGMQLTAGAFGSNVSAVTAYGKIAGTETFTSANNFWGTETAEILIGVEGVQDLTVQQAPEIQLRYPEANGSINMLGFTSFGSGVFYLDRGSFVAVTYNV